MGRGGERVLYAGVKRGRAIYKKLSFKMATAFWAIVFWKMEKEILGKWKSFDIVQLYNFMRVLVAVARVDNFRYFSCFPWDFVHILMFVSKLLTRLFENGYTKERWKLKVLDRKISFSFALLIAKVKMKTVSSESFPWEKLTVVLAGRRSMRGLYGSNRKT